MAQVIRVRGKSKDERLELEPIQTPKIVRPMVAGEIPGYADKFDRLWRIFPGRFRDSGDRSRAIKYVAEISVGDFIQIVGVWGQWCKFWSSFSVADRRFIPRMENWVKQGKWQEEVPPMRDYTKPRGAWKPDPVEILPSVPIVTRTRAEIESDCQTKSASYLGPTGRRFTVRSAEIALEDIEELQALADSLKKSA